MKGAAIALVLAAMAAGCARDDGEDELPAACVNTSARGLAAALTAAPAPVGFEGITLSECFPPDASVGDVQLMGELALDAARELGPRYPVALGYLVGVLREATEAGQGPHAEILRRVEQEAAAVADTRRFARGVRAGRTSG